ncbi:cytosine permease [Cryptococcus neoformans c8]|nr:cytosine permease [Cryptococcus neoformans var. grubii AD1-83a]OXG49740.1 cytosine permease [Cryptococcus neoformans var. grubii MW-RSA1955]OXG54019.1 cytosine permease [Cryptococcus neoformans var. grubii CHC193]OXG58799.1 cytosine permease [Cryptococcus neoformans var. grubii c8]OXH03467.1 cytosine permease [Cryptococcus neoformans var. grubii A5-35-17]OXH04699.1 cytosine permease [Cryptococcus neoformans var. grubii A1-35-8]
MSDIEKGFEPVDPKVSDSYEGLPSVDAGVYSEQHNVGESTGRWAKFDELNRKLEHTMGIESRGIERVSESDRTDTRLHGNLFIWASANTVLPTLGVGILGPLLFGLGLGDSMLSILFFNAATACIPAFMSTFGPKLGLRQMTSARYSWGFWGAKIVALLNCIACVGWSIVNTISGAQTLVAVSEYKISAAVGVVIIALVTLFIGLFGYRFVHQYERYSWLPTFITFLVMLGVSAKHLANVPWGVGQAEAAGVLSFGGTIWGFAIGWSSLSSDFNVYMPAEAKSWKVFAWTYTGLIFPLVLVEWLGTAIGCAALVVTDWRDAYHEHELGGLVGAVFIPSMHNGGKFFMTLLVLSVVANNTVNVYSMGLSVSVIANWLAAIPRLVWPCVITAIYIPIAIVGASSFATSLENFLNVLGYWLSIYATVVIEEHFIFRKGRYENYEAASTWNRSDRLPVGFAAIAAGCCGAAGAVLGMAQAWFTGPIGKKVGGTADPSGGDIGWLLAFAFTGVTYPAFRIIEKKWLRR